jgi:hypothetical protein
MEAAFLGRNHIEKVELGIPERISDRIAVAVLVTVRAISPAVEKT